MNFNFDNSYQTLPESLFSKVLPTKVKSPQIAVFNHALAEELNLDFSKVNENEIAEIFSGNKIPENTTPIAQAYAGHQFGHFNILGDGRAILLGEHLTNSNQRFDIQLKGSGITPYSRRGDGRATLSAMLREYIISEAMHYLNIPTTRSLAVIATGENVYREFTHQGAVLTRIASSHIRVGTFEYVRTQTSFEELQQFTDYVIDRHYPHLKSNVNPPLALLDEVITKQVDLIINWIRVGFIHGVMNTDNMSIAGESIDFGPCAFMNAYDPRTVFSSIDRNSRYAFGNQPNIAKWNLATFAETLLPLFDSNPEKSIALAEQVLDSFDEKYRSKWLQMMCNKLGFSSLQENDLDFIKTFLTWMNQHRADYTNTFLALQSEQFQSEDIYKTNEFQYLYAEWLKRVELNEGGLNEALTIMKQYNPVYIPRNEYVEEALEAASQKNDFSLFNSLLDVLKNPYTFVDKFTKYQQISVGFDNNYQTYCGT